MTARAALVELFVRLRDRNGMLRVYTPGELDQLIDLIVEAIASSDETFEELEAKR